MYRARRQRAQSPSLDARWRPGSIVDQKRILQVSHPLYLLLTLGAQATFNFGRKVYEFHSPPLGGGRGRGGARGGGGKRPLICYQKRTRRLQTNEARPKRIACRRLKPRVDEFKSPATRGSAWRASVGKALPSAAAGELNFDGSNLGRS
jgi:hypothetical protein